MNTNRRIFDRSVISGPVLAIALAVVAVSPVSAQVADLDIGADRGISVVPVGTTEANQEAADIAALANADETAANGQPILQKEPGAEEAVVAEAAPADIATLEAAPLAGAESPADVYEQLLGAGYDVSVVRQDQFGGYVFLVKADQVERQLLILVDAAGQVVDHRRIEPAAYTAPVQTYVPAHRPAYQNCHQPNAGYQVNYRQSNRWARY